MHDNLLLQSSCNAPIDLDRPKIEVSPKHLKVIFSYIAYAIIV